MAAEASGTLLHRGIHLFTHPTLIYSVINGRQPRFLRRNLSYTGNAALAAKLRSSRVSGSTLIIRLGDLQLAGANLPSQITLLAVLCEAASTGRDFKPLLATAVTLTAHDVTSFQHIPATATHAPNGDGAACGEWSSCPAPKGSSVKPQATLLLPLPKRQLTRPVLLLLASDGHPDLKAIVAPGGHKTRILNTDLRSGGRLLGLLPELSSVWVVVQPLEALLQLDGCGVNNGGGNTAQRGVSQRKVVTAGAGAGAASCAEAAGVSSFDSRQPPVTVTFQRGRVARSRCSITMANGTALVAMLLNLELEPGPGKNPGLEKNPVQWDSSVDSCRGGDAKVERKLAKEQLQHAGNHQALKHGSEPTPPRLPQTKSRKVSTLGLPASAAAAGAIEGRTLRKSVAAMSGRLTRRSSNPSVASVSAGGSGSDWTVALAAAAADEAQVLRLSALTISLQLDVQSIIPEAVAEATPATREEQEKENQDAVVEFRYVYDDASWSRGSTGAAAGTRRQQQQQQQLLRTEQQLIQLQQQQERRCGGDAAAGESQELGGITSTGLQSSRSGSGGGGDRASWMKQQMSRVHDATERTAVEQLGRGQVQKLGRTAKGARTHDRKWTSDSGMGNSRRICTAEGAVATATAAVAERCFIEELRVPAGAPFGCPLCAAVCRGFKGLRQHLPVSHGLYNYSFLEEGRAVPTAAVVAAIGQRGARSDALSGLGGAAGGGHGGKSVLQWPPQRFVVEVRLPAETVDPARRDLVLPEEDRLVLQKDGESVSVKLRSWAFIRSAGMSDSVYTDRAPVAISAATEAKAAAPASGAHLSLLPLSVLLPEPPDGQGGGRGPRDGRGSPPTDLGATLAQLQTCEKLQLQPQEQLQQQPQRQLEQESQGQLQKQPQQQLEKESQEQPLQHLTVVGGNAGGSGSGLAECSLMGSALMEVALESIRKSASGFPEETQQGDGAASASAAAAAAAVAVLPSVLAAGVHPPGRQYFHCRSFIPGTVHDLFGPYDSDDETDDDEWEASFDRHLAQSYSSTPLRAADRQYFKLWSGFARRRPIYSDYITRSRVLEFVRQHGELIQSNPELRSALVVHLLLLHEMNLIDPRSIQRCLLIADRRIASTAEEDERFLATRGSDASVRLGTAATAAAGAPPSGSQAAAAPPNAVGCGPGGRGTVGSGAGGGSRPSIVLDAQRGGGGAATGAHGRGGSSACDDEADGSSSGSSSGSDSDGGGGDDVTAHTMTRCAGGSSNSAPIPGLRAGTGSLQGRPPSRGQPPADTRSERRRRRQANDVAGPPEAKRRRREHQAVSAVGVGGGRHSQAEHDAPPEDGSEVVRDGSGPALAHVPQELDSSAGNSSGTAAGSHMRPSELPDADPGTTKAAPAGLVDDSTNFAGFMHDGTRANANGGGGSSSGAWESPGIARAAAGTVAAAAAVETGAVEAEGGAQSPAATGGGDGVAEGAVEEPIEKDREQVVTQKMQQLNLQQQQEQKVDRGRDHERSDDLKLPPSLQAELLHPQPPPPQQEPIGKAASTSRPNPALSWALNKKSIRVLVPPVAVTTQRLSLSAQNRATCLAPAAGPVSGKGASATSLSASSIPGALPRALRAPPPQ